MDSSRRRILQLLGLSSLALTAKPVFNAFAVEEHAEKPKAILKDGENALKAKQWALVIDTRQFESEEDLEPLVEICNKVHNVPHLSEKRHEIKWIWGEHYHNAFPGKAARFLSEEVEHKPFLVLCNHCENPPCVRACPTQATFKRESDGIVLMDFHRCIGCRFCMAACPFGARSFNFRDPRPFVREINDEFPTRMKGVVEKCNFCAERWPWDNCRPVSRFRKANWPSGICMIRNQMFGNSSEPISPFGASRRWVPNRPFTISCEGLLCLN